MLSVELQQLARHYGQGHLLEMASRLSGISDLRSKKEFATLDLPSSIGFRAKLPEGTTLDLSQSTPRRSSPG